MVRVTTACICDAGSRPSRKEALIIAVTYGSNTSTISFCSNLGIDSSMHDFVGDADECLNLHCTVLTLTVGYLNERTVAVDHGYVITMRWTEGCSTNKLHFLVEELKKGVCVVGRWCYV